MTRPIQGKLFKTQNGTPITAIFYTFLDFAWNLNELKSKKLKMNFDLI